MAEGARILVVDDEPGMRMGLRQVLRKEGYAVETAEDGEEALSRLDREPFDAVVTDLRMPKRDGMAVLAHARELASPPLVFMITAYGDVPTAVQAMQAGAADFILKPFKIDDVRSRVKTALLKRELEGEAPSEPAPEKDEPGEDGEAWAEIAADFPEIITRCPLMLRALKTVKKVAATDCAVLILGETGTGKELIARALHRLSRRCEGPFIATANAIPESLIESELFGYVKGAFTGAEADKAGYFEAADGGTLFLDEIGDLPPLIQVKLLRVIQEGEINRVGDPRPREVSARLVAATWKDLKAEVEAGRFRKDLYYRLNVITIHLPPLRERAGDVERLLRAFLKAKGEAAGRAFKIEEAALERLTAHPWPGNIRELKNRVERLVIYADQELIDREVVELAFDDAP